MGPPLATLAARSAVVIGIGSAPTPAGRSAYHRADVTGHELGSAGDSGLRHCTGAQPAGALLQNDSRGLSRRRHPRAEPRRPIPPVRVQVTLSRADPPA